MGLKQQMKQTLGMTMTPQLQQAIKILQMSVVELQQEINKELMENPTLEESSGDDDPGFGEEKNLNDVPVDSGQDSASESLEFVDTTLPGSQNYKSTRNTSLDDIPSYEQVVAKPPSLADHLNWQLRLSTNDLNVVNIGEEIIGNINEDGYLVILIEELVERLKVEKEEVEAVLYRIQRFDPPGVAARNLQECLMIQAELLPGSDELEEIIEKHLPELENKNYTAISKALNRPLDKVIAQCRMIHDMEPRPGRGFNNTESQYFVPDVYVIKVGKDFVCVLNEDGIPRLKISKNYKEQVMSGALIGDTKQYVKEKLKGAHWLLRSIFQRQRSIFRVTEAIVQRQIDFFEKGPEHLKPMVLRDIAEAVELHESTISRVTNNKYVHTPHGIFELKYFFNSAISRSDGQGDLASESVKERIRQLVSGEDTKRPLSDQQLVDMLKEENIQIARRTVAKYREALGILPSGKRKKYF
ncbi:MAG: RNA polymerase factor sigma-54 [Proteobacteria bacterium]|nr:RNA polymerase factor sigma-54 [Pseudomonadota bacterium]